MKEESLFYLKLGSSIQNHGGKTLNKIFTNNL